MWQCHTKPRREPARCSKNWINSWKCQDCMSQRWARRGVFNLQGDRWCCLSRQEENGCPPPPFNRMSLVDFFFFILVYSLSLESWLHNTSEKHSVFHQPKLCHIPPCVFLSFQLFHFGLVQFGKETLSNDVYSAASPRHHVATVSKQTERSFVLCAGCVWGKKDTDTWKEDKRSGADHPSVDSHTNKHKEAINSAGFSHTGGTLRETAEHEKEKRSGQCGKQELGGQPRHSGFPAVVPTRAPVRGQTVGVVCGQYRNHHCHTFRFSSRTWGWEASHDKWFFMFGKRQKQAALSYTEYTHCWHFTWCWGIGAYLATAVCECIGQPAGPRFFLSEHKMKKKTKPKPTVVMSNTLCAVQGTSIMWAVLIQVKPSIQKGLARVWRVTHSNWSIHNRFKKAAVNNNTVYPATL